MADVTILQSSVSAVTTNNFGAQPTRSIIGIAGISIAAGQMVFQSPIDGRYYLTLSKDSVKSLAVGMSLQTVLNGDVFTIAVGGDLLFTLGGIGLFTFSFGNIVTLGSSPGAVTQTAGDVIAGWYPGLVGICVNTYAVNVRSTSVLRLSIVGNLGITK